MKFLLLISLLLRIDHNAPIVDTFDILELNHTYNEWGGEGLVQIMGVDWHIRDRDFHVEWYKLLRDCHIKTEEGEKKWLKERRKIADKIKDWMTRLDFLNSTEYKGEFDKSHKLYPVKNWRTGYWEIKLEGRIIRAKSFQETHTTNDREVDDRKEHPTQIRRGLSKTREELKKEAEANRFGMRIFADMLEDFVGAIQK
jgi:hypothetical protein